MSPNLYLVSTCLGLGIVGLGTESVDDSNIDDIFGLIHGEENVFYRFAVGHLQ